MDKNVIDFAKIGMQDLPQVGGKNASLGEMIANLKKAKVAVPHGFATTASAYRQFLIYNKIDVKINAILDDLDVNDLAKLERASNKIRKLILNSEFSSAFIADVQKSFSTLSKKLSPRAVFVVRSSATSEDLPEASFAGQQDSFLNVSGIDNVLEAIKGVYASLFNQRAIAYRVHNKFAHRKVAISAGVQHMVRSDMATSGVMFTLDTESGFNKVVMLNASFGLGESVVKGIVNPDEFYLYKPNLVSGKEAILRRKCGSKELKIVTTGKMKLNVATKQVAVAAKDCKRFCVTDKEATRLAKFALAIEKHYGHAMDVEWAKDGITGKLYIVQARPETVKIRMRHDVIEHAKLKKSGEILLTGASVGEKIGQGKVRVIADARDKDKLRVGEVLVADITDPDWEPIMQRASAIVTNRGGRTCHAAIVARELGVPAIVGAQKATQILKTGQEVTVSCAEGDKGFVYKGLLPVQVSKFKVNKLKKLPVDIYLNLANPDSAFSLQFLPNDGVGLARLEFIINNLVGIHPRAALDFKKLPQSLQKKIAQKCVAYKNPVDYYVQRLAEGIATIAAAFYPKPVVVRLSDFKSNEYANLLGGELFEPHEENPMLGFRGVSRYISKEFQDCVALEFAALKKVRDEMGLTNVEIMLPFLRTIGEATRVVKLLHVHGLKRGKNDLKLIMMCEIPANALLAEKFLHYFDGFSIGSNDLTQLTLGVDRDSDLVAEFFIERDPAVKMLISRAIKTCNKMGKHIAICGQAPSDYPDFAKWLIEEGIDAISLNPDSVMGVVRRLHKL